MSRSQFTVRPHRVLRAAVVSATFAALTACPPPPDPGVEDAGGPPPDVCNAMDEALNDPQCELTLGQSLQGYIHPPGEDLKPDQDWYSFRVPANADARTLIHLRGGYAVPMTAVNLSLNLLQADGTSSLVRKSDRHGQAPPRPVDIILPFAEPNARLLVLVTDDPVNPSRPNSDLRSPYDLKVEVLQDPDANEPNDTAETATSIPLAPGNDGQVGTGTGWLATTGDQDHFEFEVGANKVVYLRITAPTVAPPPAFRVSYELFDGAGTKVSEGSAPNEYIAVDLATARRVMNAGTWRLKIVGYTGAGASEPVPGNLDQQYTVEVRVLDEADSNELSASNNTLDSATAVSLSAPGQTAAKTGRIGYVGDPDWYRIDLPAYSEPTVLRYRVRTSGGGGRFEALPNPDREIRLVRLVQSGSSPQDSVNACLNDQDVCPKGPGSVDFVEALIKEQCQSFTPPRCMWSRRVEHVSFEGLRNFEGTVPVPAHSSTASWYLLFQDEGNNWADDRNYTVEFSWEADADEAARISGGMEQPTQATLAYDSTGASYPVPPPGSTELTGTLSYGPGYYRRHNPNNGQGVKGPSDYDAVLSDEDEYVLALPADLTPPLDRAWELQWEIAHLPDGGIPSDLVIDLEFCDGSDPDAGVCTPVTRSEGGARLTVGYSGSAVNAWHNVGAPQAQRQPLYTQEVTGTKTTVTAAPYGCFCFEPRFIQGGSFRMKVVSVDRKDYAPTPYTIRTAWTDYPKSFVDTDGGVQSCPAPDADGGGCWFSR